MKAIYTYSYIYIDFLKTFFIEFNLFLQKIMVLILKPLKTWFQLVGVSP